MSNSDMKKSLYQAFQKALKSQNDNHSKAQAIVGDILDPDMTPNVPEEKQKVSAKSVLYKDASISEMHQQKQAQAQAAAGMMPKMPSNGLGKLKKFMDKCSMKKADKMKKTDVGSVIDSMRRKGKS